VLPAGLFQRVQQRFRLHARIVETRTRRPYAGPISSP
jgi:hypothetical protein